MLTLKDEAGADVSATVGLICPRCRREPQDEAPNSGGVARCGVCGYAFVQLASFAEADGDPFLGKTVAGRYVIVGKLGAGSMGTVYKARQEAMGRDVAVKILRSERLCDAYAKARFVREARAMSMLASPHTVTVFDFGEIRVSDGSRIDRSTGSTPPPSPDPNDEDIDDDARSLYLAMEMLEGESLGQRLRRTPRLEIEDAARIARQTLLSLAEAHDKGVIHRDLKPDNLFLAKETGGERDEICKVLDFGIAKVLTDRKKSVDPLETQAGTVFGTPRYMSPEQAQGRTLDVRSDLYTLGVLLYHMIVGRPPFGDEDAVVVMAHHIKTAPQPPMSAAPDAHIPKPVSDLILRALSKDPADRPPSAKAFMTELERALELSRQEAARDAALRSAAAADPAPSASTPPGAKTSSPPPGTPRAQRSSSPPPGTPRAQRSFSPPPATPRAQPSSSPPPGTPRAQPSSSPPPGTPRARPSAPSSSAASAPAPPPVPSSSSPVSSVPRPTGPTSAPPSTLRIAGAPSSRPGGSPPVSRVGPSSGREIELTRDGLEPNSLSSPPPSGGVAGPKPVLVISGAMMVGVLGGALAFGLLYPPMSSSLAMRSSGARETATFLGAAARNLDAEAETHKAADIDIIDDDLDPSGAASATSGASSASGASGASDRAFAPAEDASLPDGSSLEAPRLRGRIPQSPRRSSTLFD